MRNAWIIAASLAAILPAAGQTTQNSSAQGSASPYLTARRAALAGVWVLDQSRSRMGGEHAGPDYAFTKTFELRGAALVQKDHEVNLDIIGTPVPERDYTVELVPDGKEHEIKGTPFLPGMPPPNIQATTVWQGDNLVITEASLGFGGLSTTSRRYFLSDDGTELTELIVGRTGFGDSDRRLVFTRVSASH